jgi:hypothetical protein
MIALLWLAVAALAVVGWISGNLFVCVFLSLADLSLLMVFAGVDAFWSWVLIVMGMFVVIWTPRLLFRRHAY